MATKVFAKVCAGYLARTEGADYADTYRNALSNPDDLWNYLWWLNDNESRNICIEFKDII